MAKLTRENLKLRSWRGNSMKIKRVRLAIKHVPDQWGKDKASMLLAVRPDTTRNRGQSIGVQDGKEYVCQCYTQQVTKVTTSPEFCLSVVTNGMFDDTRQPPSYASGNSHGTLNTSPSVSQPVAAMERGRAAASQQPATPVVNVIADSEYSSRPWH